MSSRDQSGRSLYIGNRIAVVVVALGVLTLLGFGVLAWRPAIAPAAPPAPAGFAPALVAKGGALAGGGYCAACHTAKGGQSFAGGYAMQTPFGVIYSTNITPDSETGIGNWSLAAFERALREGVRRDGSHLYPVFPYDHFTKLSDDDVQALYAYFMTRTPVRAPAHSNGLPFPFNIRALQAGWKLLFFRPGRFEPAAGKSGECSARNSTVAGPRQSISYGEIVRRGPPSRSFTADELARMPIKSAAERRLIGHKTGALDIPAKTNGTARYGIDAAVDGMVYARPKIPPTRNGSSVRSINDSGARNVKGYIKCLAIEDPSGTVPGWVMVLANSYPAAIRAADLVKVEWTAGEGSDVSEQDILDYGAKQIADPNGGALLRDSQGIEAAFRSARSTLERTYTTGSVLHVQLEPVNALAFEKDGIFEIHAGNQWQSLILPVLAKALNTAQDRIVMRTYDLGGGF